MHKKNIILVGFMGTGKTSIGQALARRLGRRFVDVDEEIVNETGLDVAEIFRSMGEPYFRRLEKKILSECCRGEHLVVAAGGGAVCEAGNLAVMKKNGIVVCLTAPVDTVIERLRGDITRPLFEGGDGQRARELLSMREPYYRKADFMVDTAGLSVDETVEEIKRLIENGETEST